MPDALNDYHYDHQAEHQAKKMVRILGFASLGLLLTTITLFCLRQGAVAVASFAAIFVVAIAWCIVWKSKKNIKCRSCGEMMELTDAAFPEDELGKADRRRLDRPLFTGSGRSLFEGTDGCVYEVRDCDRGGLYWCLSKYNLRHYICHKCQVYFRYGNVITIVENMKTTDEIKALKSELQENGVEMA